MNILKKFTIRSLKLNKKRTFVTIIGIVLSVALICSVAGILLSFRESIIQDEITDSGKYHTMFTGIDSSSIDVVKNNKKIENYYYTQGLGYAEFGSKSDVNKYLYVVGYDDYAIKDSGLKIIMGRAPSNENEIVINEDVNINAKTDYKIGDELTLNLFDLKENVVLDENDNVVSSTEERTDLYSRKYTIVGVAEHSYRAYFSKNGISVITYAKSPAKNIELSVYYKNPKDVEEGSKIIAKEFNIDSDNIRNNRELLRWQGVLGEETLSVLYGIAGVVIGVIIFTSVFVIRNGFSISILERNKEYGILASIGATKKQIKKNVLYEGFILGLISIPIGIICGMAAVYVLIFLVRYLLADMLYMTLLYVIPYQAIIVSIVLGAVTIYLSCISVARKTSKVSPIERVRNNENIKIKAKKLKTPKIVKALFKTGGVIAYKNMKRNKAKYRTTVFSMVVSVVLFITMYSMTDYIAQGNKQMNSQIGFNLFIRSRVDNTNFYEQADKITELVDENDRYSIVKSKTVLSDNKYVNFNSAQDFGVAEEGENYITLFAIGDKAYREYVEQIGGKYEDYKNKGILIDSLRVRSNDEWKDVNLFNIQNNVELKINDEWVTLDIAQKANETPMAFGESAINTSGIIVSDEMINEIGYDGTRLYGNRC